MICIIFIAYIVSVSLAKTGLSHMLIHKTSHFRIFPQVKIILKKNLVLYNACFLLGPQNSFHQLSGTDETSDKLHKIFIVHLELC